MVNNLKTNDSYNPNSIIPKAINVYTPKMHFSYHYQKQRLQIVCICWNAQLTKLVDVFIASLQQLILNI